MDNLTINGFGSSSGGTFQTVELNGPSIFAEPSIRIEEAEIPPLTFARPLIFASRAFTCPFKVPAPLQYSRSHSTSPLIVPFLENRRTCVIRRACKRR